MNAGAQTNALAQPQPPPSRDLLLTSHPPAEYRAAIRILLALTDPFSIELLALLAVLRWRMRPR
jgi:hypothetical protein